MRQIIRRREVSADTVRYPGEAPDAALTPVQPIADFLREQGAAGAPTVAAVLVGPTDDVEQLSPYLERLGLIVIDFPKPGDGRGFSQARLLRQRCRYSGELRARGALKRDQLFFLARCGFDSFDLDPAEDLPAALGALDTFSVAYQAGSDELVRVRQRDDVQPDAG